MRLYLVDVTDRGLSEMFICESNLRTREFCLTYFLEISNGKPPYIEWDGLSMAQAYIKNGIDVFAHQVNYNSVSGYATLDKFLSPGYLDYKARQTAIVAEHTAFVEAEN